MDSIAPVVDGLPSETCPKNPDEEKRTFRFSFEGSESDTLHGSTQHLLASNRHSSSALTELAGNRPLIRAKRSRSVLVPSSKAPSIKRNRFGRARRATFTADRDSTSSDAELGAGILPSPKRRPILHFFQNIKLKTFSSMSSEEKAKLKTVEQPTGIFGVALRQSITYANVAISLVDGEGKSYIYGYVPIVVAKCGVYLKEKGKCVYVTFARADANSRFQPRMSRVFSA